MKPFCVALSGLLLAGNLAFAGELEPPGPPGSTMKDLQTIEPRTPVHTLAGSPTAVHEINESGSYYLAQNLLGQSGLHGIEILADNVTLDLMGFSLSGVPGSSSGIRSFANSGVTVRNGTIHDWGAHGIDMRSGTVNAVVDIVSLLNTAGVGIFLGNGKIEGCQADSNDMGIQIDNGSLVLSTASFNTAGGFRVDGPVHVDQVVARYNGTGLTQNSGGSAIIVNSTFTFSDYYGISVCAGNTIRNNLSSNNGTVSDGAGIQLRCGGNVVEGNHVANNDTGIEAFINGGEIVIKNIAAGNTTNYVGETGNHFGPISPLASATSPWANISE